MFSVIFDMDGTLLDTQRICVPAWDTVGSLYGIENMGDCIPEVCGMNESGWTAYIENKYPSLDIVGFKRDMREYIIKNLVVRFKKGGKELIDYLKRRGVKIAIASGSSRESILHHIGEVGLKESDFDAIVGSHDVEHGKPAPDVFLKTAELMGVKPEKCFVFEDSANGIRAGYAAGMRCIGVPDIVPFTEEIKRLMFTELQSLDIAINIFERM